MEAVAEEFGDAASLEDLFAALGYGKVGARQVLAKLVPAGAPGAGPERRRRSRPWSACSAGAEERIQVTGSDDLLVFRAKCCNPIMGEAIVGYITRGRGVSVHSRQCPNIVNLMYDPERRVDVEWDDGGVSQYASSSPWRWKIGRGFWPRSPRCWRVSRWIFVLQRPAPSTTRRPPSG